MYLDWVEAVNDKEGGFERFTKAYEFSGIHAQADGSITALEWAPGAKQLYLTGDFSKQMHVYEE